MSLDNSSRAQCTHTGRTLRRLVLALLVCLPAGAAAQSTVVLIVERSNAVVAEGVATVVAPDTLLTGRSLLALGDRWSVTNTQSGARLLGETLAESADLDLAVLRVSGLGLAPVGVAESAPEPGRIVDSVHNDGGRSRGLVTALDESGVEHTAAYPAGQFAAPLVNNCGQLVALNRTPLEGRGRRMRIADLSLPRRATGIRSIRAFFQERDLPLLPVDTPCTSLAQQIETLEAQTQISANEQARLSTLKTELQRRAEELERAQREISAELAAERAARERLAEAAAASEQERQRERQEQAEQREAAERQREQAQREIEAQEAEIERQREQAQREIEAREAEIERQREQAQREIEARETALGQAQEDRSQLMLKALLTGVVALLVILAALVLLRRRKDELASQGRELSAAESRLAAATKTFPDVLLAGRFPEGTPARLRINGNALARAPHGLVLGRHPESVDLVLDHSKVSRQHLRITLVENRVYITDLNSLNGTRVNDSDLEPGTAFEVRHDDILSIGETEVQIKIMDEVDA